MESIKNAIIVAILWALVATADRLDHLRPSPLPILSSTHPVIYHHHTATPPSYPTAVPTVHRAITPKPTLSPSYRPPPSISQPIQTHTHSDKIHQFIPIVKESNDPNYGDGSYSYGYETGNGIAASEVGVFQPGQTPEDGGQTASGSFSFTGPDNVVYSISYTAGPEGFVPVGAHIPTPPPIPEAIQRAIQYNLGEEPSKRFSSGPAVIPAYTGEQTVSAAAAQRYTAAFTKQYPAYGSSTTQGTPLLNKLLVPNNVATGNSNTIDYRVQEDNENYTK